MILINSRKQSPRQRSATTILFALLFGRCSSPRHFIFPFCLLGKKFEWMLPKKWLIYATSLTFIARKPPSEEAIDSLIRRNFEEVDKRHWFLTPPIPVCISGTEDVSCSTTQQLLFVNDLRVYLTCVTFLLTDLEPRKWRKRELY